MFSFCYGGPYLLVSPSDKLKDLESYLTDGDGDDSDMVTWTGKK